MTIDAAFLELLAASEQLALGYARSLRAVQNLTSASLEGRGHETSVLLAYQAQAEEAATDLERFRALVAHYKTLFRVR